MDDGLHTLKKVTPIGPPYYQPFWPIIFEVFILLNTRQSLLLHTAKRTYKKKTKVKRNPCKNRARESLF